MSAISTHVLDTALGCPAPDLVVHLARQAADGTFVHQHSHVTNADGRVSNMLSGAPLQACTYRLTFVTGSYLQAKHASAFFPQIEIVFHVTSAQQHHHVPLLLSPFGYATYRGS